MKITTLLAALLLTCTSAQALTDAESRDIIYQTQRDQDRSIASQERFIRESNEGYRQLQDRWDREDLNKQRQLDEAERQYLYKQRRNKY